MMQVRTLAFYVDDCTQGPEDLHCGHKYHVLSKGAFHRDVTKLNWFLKADKCLSNKCR